MVAQQLLGIAADRRWIRYARKHLIDMFPDLPGQLGYGKRLRGQAGGISAVITELARDVDSWHDLLRLVDSTPLPCGGLPGDREMVEPGRTLAAATAPHTPATSGDSGST